MFRAHRSGSSSALAANPEGAAMSGRFNTYEVSDVFLRRVATRLNDSIQVHIFVPLFHWSTVSRAGTTTWLGKSSLCATFSCQMHTPSRCGITRNGCREVGVVILRQNNYG
jgi:hypothetical protein